MWRTRYNHIKRLVTLTSGNIKRFSLHYNNMIKVGSRYLFRPSFPDIIITISTLSGYAAVAEYGEFGEVVGFVGFVEIEENVEFEESGILVAHLKIHHYILICFCIETQSGLTIGWSLRIQQPWQCKLQWTLPRSWLNRFELAHKCRFRCCSSRRLCCLGHCARKSSCSDQ